LKKCRPILESFSINAPVAVRCFVLKQATQVDGEMCPGESAKDDKIESTEKQMDHLVSPFGDDVPQGDDI